MVESVVGSGWRGVIDAGEEEEAYITHYLSNGTRCTFADSYMAGMV